MTSIGEPRLIQTLPGVDTDRTALVTEHWTAADKIRFVDGYPQKIGGWESKEFDNSNTIGGVVRSIYSLLFSSKVRTIFGTHTRMYSLAGSELINVTPLSTSATAAANSLATDYNSLTTDPIATTDGSTTLTITFASAEQYDAGDTVTLSGASATNGVPAGEINTSHIVRSVPSSSTFTISVSTAATSTGSGGGGSVVLASGLISVTKTAHGLTDGDRVNMDSAADTGGVTAAQINVEHIIRTTASANIFNIMTAGTATSSVSSGGGASTQYYEQIAAGDQNETTGQGYGMGKFGVGLYGTALPSSSGRNYVRTWFMDKYGSALIATAGNQTGVYTWDGDTSAAPTLVSNAPTAVNYAFVSDNILVTFGASGTENKIFASDLNDITQWTASSTNSVYENNLEGYGRLISHVSVPGNNLIFTERSCHTFRKIDLRAGVWELKLKDPKVGIISAMARVAVDGVAYWMGQRNFYMWRGGKVDVIPSNNPRVKQSTILRYVFDDLNTSQKSKIFAWHNEKYDEIWWHYPSSTSNEPDRVARFSLRDYTWVTDTMDRTAAEYPRTLQVYPKLADSSSVIYDHETGADDDDTALAFSLTSNYKVAGKNNGVISSFVPDSNQSGDINVNITGRSYPQSSSTTFNKDYAVDSTTERVAAKISGRLWQYTISGEELAQTFEMGDWYEFLQQGSPK